MWRGLLCGVAAFIPLALRPSEAAEPRTGALEVVAELPINPGNVTATADGRVFATVHQFRRAPVQLIEVTGKTSYRPWPDEAWNGAFGSGPDVFNSLLGVVVDRKSRLWVIDNGQGEPHQPPKLLAFDTATGWLAHRYDFPEATGPKGSFLQDLAVDDARGFVFVADAGGALDPAIVMVDTHANRSRRFTASPALQPEDVDMVVEGRRLRVDDGRGGQAPARVGINPITISADGETLYFGAMTGRAWYGVPTRLFREGADDATIATAIRRVGEKPVSDGASTDADGNHFFTDVGANAIARLDAGGRLTTLVRDDRLIWPDSLRFGPQSWLYIAVNQLNRTPFFNDGVDDAEPPYRILRVWTGTRGIPGR